MSQEDLDEISHELLTEAIPNPHAADLIKNLLNSGKLLPFTLLNTQEFLQVLKSGLPQETLAIYEQENLTQPILERLCAVVERLLAQGFYATTILRIIENYCDYLINAKPVVSRWKSR
jgi:hypothetical protein